MNVLDGRDIHEPMHRLCDVVVVGSGPSGATVARELAERGSSVVIVEDGALHRPEEFPADSWAAMAMLYRDMGATVSRDLPPMPFVQGRAVGGTSVVNGAISWRLPRDVYERWCRETPAIRDALPWEEIERATDETERDLHISPTDPAIAGDNNRLLGVGAEAIGLEHRPIRRNVRGCEGLGRCLQGCPRGHKQSMAQTYLPQACERGALILASTRATSVETRDGRAVAIRGRTHAGAPVRVEARDAVVLAASAVHSPGLLEASGLTQGPVGEYFSAHPGVSVTGRFDQPVEVWKGATQGHEVIGLREEGLKFEALGYDIAMAASRLKGVGDDYMKGLRELGHQAHWGAAVKADALGRVRRRGGDIHVHYSLTDEDLIKMRRGIATLARMMFAAGAEEVYPGIAGWDPSITHPDEIDRLESDAPLDSTAYRSVVTHMFGTCRMGSDPQRSVVDTSFEHHHVERLFVADSSVFPTNTGVNPQTSIIALARICAQKIARAP